MDTDYNHFLPKRVIEQIKFTPNQWNQQIHRIWCCLNFMTTHEAMVEYFKIVENLNMYGIHYFEAVNDRGNTFYLGIDTHGIIVYSYFNKIFPRNFFYFDEMRNALQFKRKISVIPTNSDRKFTLTLERSRIARLFCSMVDGYNSRLNDRVQPISYHVQLMRANAADIRKIQKIEEQLQKEKEAREKAETTSQYYLGRMKTIQSEMKLFGRSLASTYDKIRSVKKKLDELHKARSDLENHAIVLDELNTRLKTDQELEDMERERLMQEVNEKNQEYDRLKLEIEQKSQLSDEVNRIATKLNTDYKKHTTYTKGLVKLYYEPEESSSSNSSVAIKPPNVDDRIEDVEGFATNRPKRPEPKFLTPKEKLELQLKVNLCLS